MLELPWLRGDRGVYIKSPTKKKMMKVTLVLLALATVALAEVSKRQVGVALVEREQDGCLTCVDDIMLAIADCGNSDVDILTCIADALGAASDCLGCICEILSIIGGFDDVCP